MLPLILLLVNVLVLLVVGGSFFHCPLQTDGRGFPPARLISPIAGKAVAFLVVLLSIILHPVFAEFPFLLE